MDMNDMYAVSDLIIQKLESLQDESQTGDIERLLLRPYVGQLKDLQNAGLIQSYANEVFGGILQTVVFKIMHELTKKEPDINKVLNILEPIDKFMKEKIGHDYDEIERRIGSPDSSIIEDLETLEKEISDWVKNMPHVAIANEVPDDIKRGLNELKEQFMKMKKENNEWSK